MNGDRTLKLVVDTKNSRGLFLEDHGYETEEAHVQAIWDSNLNWADIEGILEWPLVCSVTNDDRIINNVSMTSRELCQKFAEAFHDLRTKPNAGGVWSFRKMALHSQLRP